MNSKHKAVSYTRDIDNPNAVKFDDFNRLIRQTDCNAVDTVLIAHPKVLGDNYDELVANLNRLARAGLALAIVGPSK